MQRRTFIKTTGLLAAVPAVQGVAAQTGESVKTKEIYEWRIYTLAGDGVMLDVFFEQTLIPAYNRQGVKVGAFRLKEKEEAELRYLLFVYPDLAVYHKVKRELWSDVLFREAARPFYDATAVNPAYTNFESYLCEAFDAMPVMRMPGKERTLFEIRLYHSPNEEANRRKIKMFNEGEIAIFDETGINSVCYGEILAGARMPALIYLTWYKDEEAHGKAWSAFRKHPEWIRIKDLPEYAHTATNNKNRQALPMPYSQI